MMLHVISVAQQDELTLLEYLTVLLKYTVPWIEWKLKVLIGPEQLEPSVM